LVPTATREPIFIGSDIYRRTGFGRNHPLAIPRVVTVMDLCARLGWLDGRFVDSPRASEDELARFHDPAYIAAVREASAAQQTTPEARERYGLGSAENPIFPGLFERATTACGGSILAAKHVLNGGGVAYHPSGGTHHSWRDRARGFCYFNDPVLCLYALLDGGLSRVYYVDLDAHHGDGVEEAFADDDRVFTLSIHEERRWPHSGRAEDRRGGLARNLPVPRGFNDSELEYLMETAVLPLGRAFAPEAVVVICGADNLKGDPLSKMELSNVALWRAVGHLIRLSPRAVVLGGGGYNPWNVARAWTGLWGMLNGFSLPEALPADAEAILRGLRSDLIDDDIPDAWFTTLVDAANPGPLRDAVKAVARLALAP
jgi:acetoin utilization protein AcuC